MGLYQPYWLDVCLKLGCKPLNPHLVCQIQYYWEQWNL